MPRRVSVATRFPRQHVNEANGRLVRTKNVNKDEERNSGKSSDETKTWSYLFFGSQHSRSRPVGEKEKLEYLDLLPPKALREEEYELSALMVHSR